jgi:integrase/recombinase XerD
VNVSAAVSKYIAWKRQLGFRFKSDAKYLSSFSFRFGQHPVADLRLHQVAKFLNSANSGLCTRHTNYGILMRFFQYLQRRGQIQSVPLPVKPPRSENNFVPYIYSRTEIRRLVSDRAYKDCRLRPITAPETLRALLLFLYGSGLSIGEAITLEKQSLDFRRRTMAVSRHLDQDKRLIPMGKDVYKLLARHLASPEHSVGEAPYVFTARSGKPLSKSVLMRDFKLLRQTAGIFRTGGPWNQPRMHDLRYTFAVHRITSWYRLGADVERMLPALAIYMGHKALRPIHRYLSLTPEHFRKQVAFMKSR